MALCLVIFLMQLNNREVVTEAFTPYCKGLNFDESAVDSPDFLYLFDEDGDCQELLEFYHSRPDQSVFPEIVYHWAEKEEPEKVNQEPYTKEELEEAIKLFEEHYNKAVIGVPASLDAKLMYDPRYLNPIRMLTSALAHADWWHIIFNLIFFFAFAVALEYIIDSPWRFILSLVAIEFVTGIAYSLAVLGGAEPLPTLGLSGSVMGVIGMSAYLLPNVRIRVFVWIWTSARNFHIPAIYLVLWYIGWDTYDLLSDPWSSGVNLVAHVSGGFAGYFIARYFFKQRREDTKDEVDDEVEYMGSLRRDKLGLMSSYRSKDKHLSNALAAERANRDYATWADHIHSAINTEQDAKAINLILSRYDDYRHAIELYEELYQEMLNWKHSRAVLCLSRLLIGEYLETRKYAKAIQVAQTAYQISSEFVFAEDQQKTLLFAMAKRQGIKLEPKPA